MWVSWGQSAFFRMSSIPKGIREPQGGFPFFTRRGSNFLRMWIVLKEKRDPPGRDLRGLCEGPARGLILDNREKY